MRVGALLLLCLVLQLSLAGSKKAAGKQRSNVLHKAVSKHVHSESFKTKVRSTTQKAMGEESKQHVEIAARKGDIEHKHYKTESKILKRSIKDSSVHRAPPISLHVVQKSHTKREVSHTHAKHEHFKTLTLAKRSDGDANGGIASDIGETHGSEILEEKLPGGYGEVMSENDDDENSGNDDESGDDESGSGTSETPPESNGANINEKSVDRDEDDVTQIVQSELKEEASRGNGASVAESLPKKSPSLHSIGAKRQPKGEWVCKKRCASPMSYEECANPRCSYKIGTIKDLCFFLCKHQQPVCKEVCKYE